MTSGAGLLWLVEEGLPDDMEGSRDEVGGVLIIMLSLPAPDSFLIAAILGMSLISTRSSSSLSLACPPPRRDGPSSSEVGLHTASGSMVTWSTSLGVDLSMLSTYLEACQPSQMPTFCLTH